MRDTGDSLNRTVLSDNQAVFAVFPLGEFGQESERRAGVFDKGIDHVGHRIVRIVPAQRRIQESEEKKSGKQKNKIVRSSYDDGEGR